MPNVEESLKHAIIDVYREELRARYLLDNVRRFPIFNPLPDSRIDDLREYFLECIYPASPDRDRLDGAYDRMREIIRTPRRLTPLMKMAFKTVWRLGTLFPSAVAAGTHTLETYAEIRRLETKMVEYATRNNLTVERLAERDSVVRMIVSVPESEMVRFRTEALKLFESLSNIKLLSATVEIMDSSRKVMESRPDLYDAEELAGFDLGSDVLRRGLALFQKLKPTEFPLIIEGIKAVEIDWYDRIKMEAAR
jgi:hypothetical protein